MNESFVQLKLPEVARCLGTKELVEKSFLPAIAALLLHSPSGDLEITITAKPYHE